MGKGLRGSEPRDSPGGGQEAGRLGFYNISFISLGKSSQSQAAPSGVSSFTQQFRKKQTHGAENRSVVASDSGWEATACEGAGGLCAGRECSSGTTHIWQNS